ncbi:MAG: 1,4-alpha-glucan branching protein GlgB [Opitutales bacterium]|nr:1,4-alpha-glucan branching protein GlgB [Opitutales bacterium]
MILAKTDLQRLLEGKEANPHFYFGMHPHTKGRKKGQVIRCRLANAKRCLVVHAGKPTEEGVELERITECGFFEGWIPEKSSFPYQFRIEDYNGQFRQIYDPYSFASLFSPDDLYLFNQGNDHRCYNKLGAHLKEIDGVKGVSFAVWAPNAERVSVVGDFNQWDGRYHPMRRMDRSGVWEIFLPGLEEGEKYKYEIFGRDGHLRLKTDPYATYYEAPPNNASIVYDLRGYDWGDEEWIRARDEGKAPVDRPISVYEIHLGSWKRHEADHRPLTYRELAHQLTDYVLEMGFTHVEILPVAEHPFTGSWGYQVSGFFAPTHRFGDPKDFMYFVDYLHRHGIGIIVDWVPGHFPKDTFALAQFDGTHLYEHADPRQGEHKDWGTLIFNYGREEVNGFLVSNALSWMDRYHIDGLRVDAVASMLYLDYSREEGEWIPNQYGGRENIEAIEFLRKTNDVVHKYHPGVLMIAEESTSWGGVTKPTSEYGLGFDLKWNMGWMHDTLEYFAKDPLYRKHHHSELTFGMLYQYSEKFISVFSHDEVVHGKGSMLMKMGAGTIAEKAAHLRSLYGYMWMYPGKKLLFMGSEFGQSEEWKYDDQLQWHLRQYLDHEGLRLLVKDLNHLYQKESALSCRDLTPEGFRWVNGGDTEQSVLTFLRQGEKAEDIFLIVCHFTPIERRPYRVGVPFGGYWEEILNTNASCYGGTGLGNMGGVQAESYAWDGFEQSLNLYIPPHSVSVFRWKA